MAAKKKPVFVLLFFSAIVFLIFLIMQPLQVLHYKDKIAFLFPDGIIGLEERNLLLIIQGLMLLVILPVYILTFIFSWKYRADNKNATYNPDLVDNKLAEIIWWGLPAVMTLIVSVLTWVETHELDPFKPIPSDKPPLQIQVVALQWKWLFIYPEEKIATVNTLHIPVNRPVQFIITADAPMNSFWIPDLGGQIYAMPKMRTELNLIANESGIFRGRSANISGEGFADMYFNVHATDVDDYDAWVKSAQSSQNSLTYESYNQTLAKASVMKPEMFVLGDIKLFDQILMKYMHPIAEKEH